MATKYLLNDSQHATIMAALRFWQRCGRAKPGKPKDEFYYLATDSGECAALSNEEIDRLCLYLNGGGEDVPE
jgi:hypothetical protein